MDLRFTNFLFLNDALADLTNCDLECHFINHVFATVHFSVLCYLILKNMVTWVRWWHGTIFFAVEYTWLDGDRGSIKMESIFL